MPLLPVLVAHYEGAGQTHHLPHFKVFSPRKLERTIQIKLTVHVHPFIVISNMTEPWLFSGNTIQNCPHLPPVWRKTKALLENSTHSPSMKQLPACDWSELMQGRASLWTLWCSRWLSMHKSTRELKPIPPNIHKTPARFGLEGLPMIQLLGSLLGCYFCLSCTYFMAFLVSEELPIPTLVLSTAWHIILKVKHLEQTLPFTWNIAEGLQKKPSALLRQLRTVPVAPSLTWRMQSVLPGSGHKSSSSADDTATPAPFCESTWLEATSRYSHVLR